MTKCLSVLLILLLMGCTDAESAATRTQAVASVDFGRFDVTDFPQYKTRCFSAELGGYAHGTVMSCVPMYETIGASK